MDYRVPDMPGAVILSGLYAITSIYTLLQVLAGTTGFSNPVLGVVISLVEIGLGLLATATLQGLSIPGYTVTLRLIFAHIVLAAIFIQWQSPAVWIAIVIAFYLLRPSIWNVYGSRQARQRALYRQS